MDKMMINDRSTDTLYMLKCLLLAEKGAGYVSPNPMVGAILVNNGKIIGYGYHRKFGGAHAEVHAIRSAKGNVRGAVLYVNLEPCNHFGKTPPCTKLIIDSGIMEVVIGMRDPNPLVNGNGIRELRRAGINVRVGICSEECERLNQAFIKYVTKRMPFVTLKIAQTLDGKIADSKGKSKWISSPLSRSFVHRLRSRHDAVLVGAGTIINDNPKLTVREVKGRNPARIIIDGRFTIPLNARVFSNQSEARTILVTSNRSLRHQAKKKEALNKRGVEILGIPAKQNGTFSLKNVLITLAAKKQITSILVEGGASIFSSFLENKLADKVLFVVAPKVLGTGLNPFANITHRVIGSEIPFHHFDVQFLGQDILIEAYLH